MEDRILRRLEQLDVTRLEWKEFVPDYERHAVESAVILKPQVSEREKGVLFIARPNHCIRFLSLRNLDEFARSYALVIAPTWSPSHSLFSYVFPKSYPDTVFSLIANARDVETVPRLSKNYRVVPLYASSWVNPDEFRPLPHRERDIDMIMVANFSRFKRHFALFKALRKMPPHLRVMLIGQDQDGRGPDAIYQEARYYNVHKQLAIKVNVPRRELVESLCRSRVSLILSRREGSCTSVAESLFANTPMGMFEDAQVGSRAFINESTGCLFKHGDFSAQLRDLLARATEYSPREWAERNISCHRSTTVLNEAIRSHLQETGQEWTRDIAPFCLDQVPHLILAEDQVRMQATRDDLKDRFGFEIGPARESMLGDPVGCQRNHTTAPGRIGATSG
ncbi:MAG: glycosyltransferase [Isosphaeraceae bacterium]